MIKKILILSSAFILSGHSFPSLDFMHKQNNAKKTGLVKIGLGTALILPSLVPINSIPLNIAQFSGDILGSGLVFTGLYEILVEILAEQDEQKSLHLKTPHFDNFAHTIARNKEFLAGAAFAAAGLALYNAGQTSQASDSSIALTAIGLGLMGVAALKQFNKDYLPHILANLNK